MLNQAACRIIGRPRDELIGKSDFDVFPSAEAEVFWQKDDLVLKTGVPSLNEEKITGAEGVTRVIQTKKSRYVDSSGSAFIVGVIDDITARKSAETEIKRMNARLAAANEELESFAFSVSHDLRAPLRRIEGFSAILEEDLGGAVGQTAGDTIDRILSSVHHMSDLIDSLLTLSRMSQIEFYLDEIDLSAIAKEELADLEGDAADSPTEITIPSGLVAYGDRRLVRSVLKNLLSNAWKFSTRSKPRVVEVGRLNDEDSEAHGFEGQTVFFVRDNGVGFDMKDAGRLFRPFKRLHADDDFPGIGIGLATVRRIIHRHGGQVWVKSRLGDGTTVFFTLA